MTDITLRYLLFGEDRSASKAVQGVGGSANKTAQHLERFGEVAAAGLAAAGLAAVKMGADFQEQMTSLVTGAGESQANIKTVSAGLLKMSGDVGTSATELAKGMYMVESAGFHGAQGLKVMQAAAEGAKVGGADMATVADAVTSALNAYGLQGRDAAKVTSQLVETVASGKMHMQDLAGSLGVVLPAAAKLHIPLAQLTGAIATMTAQGTPAADAATYLKQTLANLAAPGAKAQSALHSIGLSAKDVSNMVGKGHLLGAVQAINEHMQHKFPQGGAAMLSTLKDIAGGTKTMQGLLELTGGSMGKFADNAKAIGGATSEAGGHVQGWALVQKDFNTKLHEAIATVQSMAIELGTKLLPVVTKVADFISKNVIPALSAMGSWIQRNKSWLEPLVIVLGTTAAALMAVHKAIVLWRDAQAALNLVLDANPIGLVIVAVAALAAGLIYAYKHSATFRDVVHAVFHDVATAATDMWDVIRPVLKLWADTWLLVVGVLVHGAADAFGWVPGLGGKLKAAAKHFDEFRDSINSALSGIHDKTVNVNVDLTAAHAANTALHKASPLTIGSARAAGGPVGPGGMYLVGERGPEVVTFGAAGYVTPNSQSRKLLAGDASGIGGRTQVTIQVNGLTRDGAREIDKVLRQLSRETGGALGYA